MVSAPFFGFFTDEIERVTGAFFVREVIIFFGEAAFGAGAFAAVRLERCDVVLATGFAAEAHRGLLVVEKEPEALLDALATWTPPPQGPKWIDRR